MTEQLSHGFFIWASYGVTFGVIGSLILWLTITGRSRRMQIAALSKEPASSNDA